MTDSGREQIDFSSLVPADGIKGESRSETRRLRSMLAEAREFLVTKKWCDGILEAYFGGGVGDVVGVFLFRIKPLGATDDWLWVVVGDLPTAYLVTDDARDGAEALGEYCALMQAWVDGVRAGLSLEGVFPVPVPADLEHADLLQRRLDLLRTQVIPEHFPLRP